MPVPETYNPADTEPESKHLRAADYKIDQRWKLTICDVNLEEMPGRDGQPPRKRLILSFQDRDKGLVLNATNKGFIEARLGKMPNAWIGAEIILHRTTTQYAGETVPALRVIDLRGGSAPVPDPEDSDQVPF